MSISFTSMKAITGNCTENAIKNKGSVYNLAVKCLESVVNNDVIYDYLLAATSCPDSIAPSLGQCINQHFHTNFSNTSTIDIVQGCAGGVSALILGSQLSEINKCNVIVITADAAQKATSKTSKVYEVFKNGVFGCCISYTGETSSMLHHQSRQFKDLYNIISISLGHDADDVIVNNIDDMLTDPRKHLGLKVNNEMAIRLMQKAEDFYLEFIKTTGHPDILILHQVNVLIINHLEKVFSKYPVTFINVAAEIGNCGCATTGVVLEQIKDTIKNKKVMICSFGTGGVITAGMWQF